MSEENDNNATPENNPSESLPEDQAGDSQIPDAKADAEGVPQVDGHASDNLSSEESESLAAAMETVSQVQGVADSASISSATNTETSAFQAPVFENNLSSKAKEGMDLLSDVHMNVRIELGRTKMYVEDVLKLGDGAFVELDKLAGDPVDVFVNDRKVAKGEVLVLNDMFCVRISEIVDIASDNA